MHSDRKIFPQSSEQTFLATGVVTVSIWFFPFISLENVWPRRRRVILSWTSISTILLIGRKIDFFLLWLNENRLDFEGFENYKPFVALDKH